MELDKFKKQNALINAFTSNKIIYKEVHHDLLNLFMSIIQKKYNSGDYNFDVMNISQEIICNKANVSKINLFQNIKDLMNINYILTKEDKARLKKNGLNISDGAFSFITSIIKNIDNPNKPIYKITFNNELFKFLLDKNYCLKNGNYTEIQISDISLLKGKHQKILAEILLSHKYKKEFSLDYDFLIKKFNIQSKYLVGIIKKVAISINKQFIKFEYEIHKKDKKISFRVLK